MKLFNKFYTFFFKKPNIKIGDHLSYYDSISYGLYYDWSDALWYIKIDEDGQFLISYDVELFFKNKK